MVPGRHLCSGIKRWLGHRKSMVLAERWSVDSLVRLSSRSVSDYGGPGTGALSCLTGTGGNRDLNQAETPPWLMLPENTPPARLHLTGGHYHECGSDSTLLGNGALFFLLFRSCPANRCCQI